ncbi:hypothetical protein GCM10007907_34550 [Chitinimonas prasina]|uniref:YcxB family protein n=1 Tax=Chitinimonas prasina TaxID=1434937 RepID=A0ABQ5YMP6_9NEIS|nr:hypothetical protein [Chitinimonas prasina]GLR14665.1 hypothetical protein GCM10007907_34550 [Chitinimonas prasina]
MTATTTPQVSLADLSRWLRVDEGDTRDRLELASAWQRLPEGSTDRMVVKAGGGMAALIIGLLLVQAALTDSGIVLGIALVGLALAGWMAWVLRALFWRTVVEVDAERVLLAYRGWGTPKQASLLLDQISELLYRMDEGRLVALTLVHQGGQLAVPFSGQRELDRLYCNLLKHLLQKRQPGISFGMGSDKQ